MEGSNSHISVFDPKRRRKTTPAELYDGPRWYACRTRARAEKQVARLLSGSGTECYLPLIEQERQWADRKKRVAFPLFPGYAFARFVLSGLHEILRTPGVVTVIRTDGHPAPIRKEELDSVRVLEAAAKETGVVPSPVQFFQPGDEIIVVSGPFEGMIGVLLDQRSTGRVAVRLGAIQQAMAIQLNPEVLRPLAQR